MRDHAFTVNGGQVTAARRVNKRKDLWKITVAPDGNGPVSIQVPPQQECGKAGALCTAEGQSLSSGLARVIPGPSSNGVRSVERAAPLTAKFKNGPAEHDGASAFTLRVVFSEALPKGSKSQLRRALSVTGGSKSTILRVNGRLDRWMVNVTPSGTGEVTVSLHSAGACGEAQAICTGDGRALSKSVSVRIPGPPGLSVADAEVQEGSGATLEFAVTLSHAASGTVMVDYATSDGTATAGSDYTTKRGTLSFDPGETEKTISVTVLDDAHDEGRETLTLTLSNPVKAYLADDRAIGTIVNSDPLAASLAGAVWPRRRDPHHGGRQRPAPRGPGVLCDGGWLPAPARQTRPGPEARRAGAKKRAVTTKPDAPCAGGRPPPTAPRAHSGPRPGRTG